MIDQNIGHTRRLEFAVDRATEQDIAVHLERCDPVFVPKLSSRVCIAAYSSKIRRLGVTFEAWAGNHLVGLVACYLNDGVTCEGFITNVSVEPEWQGRSAARTLLSNALAEGRARGLTGMRLEVNRAHARALHLYESLGFEREEARGDSWVMRLAL